MDVKNSRTIKLGKNDSAIVFYADGTEEIHIPNGKPNEEAPASALKCMKCAIALHDKQVSEFVNKQMRKQLDG